MISDKVRNNKKQKDKPFFAMEIAAVGGCKMINLLSKGENRRLAFVQTLSQCQEWVTLGKLSRKLNASERVLKEDIRYFETHFTDFTIQTSSDGVKMTFQDSKGLKTLYQKVLESSPAYNLLEIIFLDETKTVADLAEMLFVSSATVYRLIEQINAETAHYHFKIETNPCRVTGDEDHIRYFYYQYFFEKYSRVEWPYDKINEAVLDELLKYFLEFNQVSISFAVYNMFKLVIVVNLIRFQHNHFVELENISKNFNRIILEPVSNLEILKRFEYSFNVKFDRHLITQLFTPVVREGFYLSAEHLLERAQESEETAAEITFLDNLLIELSEKFGIRLSNKERLIFVMQNAVHLEYQGPQSGYILYNRNKYFAEAIHNQFPCFYDSLYEAMKAYRGFVEKPITEDGIQFYIYTLFTNWESLIPELRKRLGDIHVLVVSDRHVSHAKMLRDFMTGIFSDKVKIDIYEEISLEQGDLMKLGYDFIVVNFPVPNVSSPHFIYIENLPSRNDILKLQKAVSQILAKRAIHLKKSNRL